MKKIYIFFLGLFALLGMSNSVQAKIIVTDTTEYLTNEELTSVQVGDQLMFFCYGDDTHRAWLYENWTSDVAKPSLSRNFALEDIDSRSYVWTVIALNDNGDGSIDIKLQTPSGKYMKGFTIDESSKWSYWNSDNMFVETEDEAVFYTVAHFSDNYVTTEILPTWFSITDPETNGMWNGQGVNSQGIGNFVGWDGGSNSIYMIKKATLEERRTINVTLECQDQDENPIDEDGNVEKEYLPGDSLYAPDYEHYTFKTAYDVNEQEVSLPVQLGEEDAYYRLVYEKWPQITFILQDEDGNMLATTENYYEVGTTFEAPENSAVAMGYELATTEYDGHVYSYEDDQGTFTLTYRKNPTAGLPFVPTTVTDGQFAADTKYYKMKIRNHYTYLADPAASLGVSIAYDKTAKQDITINTDSIDYAVWAFTGNLSDGFTIYNLGIGADRKVYAVNNQSGTQMTMGTDAEISAADAGAGTAVSLFNLSTNSNGGYNFTYRNADGTSTNACMNHYSELDALKFWTTDAALTDAGSNILFEEISLDEVNNTKWAKSNGYAHSEGMVGGWTAEQLTSLNAAITAKDLSAAQTAIAALAEADTIAFDASKTYQIISAYQGFVISQPEATYAVYATADDSVRWGALEDTEAYQWAFTAASDSSYIVTNIGLGRAIVGWRYETTSGVKGYYVVLNGGAEVEEKAEGVNFAPGEVAPFNIVKSALVPAAYRLVHYYSPSGYVTLACKQDQGDATQTGGVCRTSNTVALDRANVWRLKPVGDKPTGISNAAVVPAGEQTNTIFDLSGRRVNNAQKGLYIINGQKVLVK